MRTGGDKRHKSSLVSSILIWTLLIFRVECLIFYITYVWSRESHYYCSVLVAISITPLREEKSQVGGRLLVYKNHSAH